MITSRDEKILELIEKVGAVKASHVQKIFMKENKQGRNISERRLKRLCELNMVHRTRAFINTEYIYYQKKTLLEHKLVLSEFYTNLFELPGRILKFEVEHQLDDVRPDAICDYLYLSNVYQFLVEIHLATVPFDQSKYESFYSSGKYHQWYKVFPRIIIVSDRDIKLQPSRLRYIKIPTNCKEIDRILK